jgi:hypothetical protein
VDAGSCVEGCQVQLALRSVGRRPHDNDTPGFLSAAFQQ